MTSKNIIISGGSRGLGLCLVNDLLVNGHRVATFSRHRTSAIDDLLARYPAHFYWQMVDASEQPQLYDFVKQTVSRYERIDGLINNAAAAIDGVISLINPEKIHQLLQLNLAAVFHLTQLCVTQMLLQSASVIINISSIIGQRGYSGLSVYSATKAGLDGMTRALARELGPKNIRVNSIAPGYMETEMSKSLDATQRQQIVNRTPLGRMGRVEDITGMVRFLLSEQAAFITGQTFVIDGGITC